MYIVKNTFLHTAFSAILPAEKVFEVLIMGNYMLIKFHRNKEIVRIYVKFELKRGLVYLLSFSQNIYLIDGARLANINMQNLKKKISIIITLYQLLFTNPTTLGSN